ncbi:MAG: response regulator [Desulfobacteraceae bacterium]|nr:response regulator [Desulfobacteraceae bacterium]
MVIDDEADIANIIKLRLMGLGYNVVMHTDPLKALRFFKETSDNFDLVITDMTMPHLTGDKLIQEIMELRPEIKTIICTGYSEKIDEKKALKIGVDAYIMKPIEGETLAKTVRMVLDKKIYDRNTRLFSTEENR